MEEKEARLEDYVFEFLRGDHIFFI